MTPLRRRMAEDMEVRSLSPHTQTSYIGQVSRFARHFGQSPERLGLEQIRDYQVFLSIEKQLAPHSIGIAVAALRFLYRVTLKKDWDIAEAIPAPQQPKTLPVVPSPEEVVRFLACVRGRNHSAILTACYAAGLRISEAIGLRPGDIDSARMVLRVEQGKGAKDRQRHDVRPRVLAGERQQRLAAVHPQVLQKPPHLLQALVRGQVDPHDHPPMVSTSPRAVRPGSPLVGNNPLVQAHVTLDNAQRWDALHGVLTFILNRSVWLEGDWATAEMSRSIRATFRPSPRLTVEAARCDNSIVAGAESAVARFSLEDLVAHVVVPVQQRVCTTRLSQMTVPNWDRHLVSNPDLGRPCFHPPVLLSPRTTWYLREQSMEVFDRAVVVDGAKRLESALRCRSTEKIPVTVVFGLDPEQELTLRRQVQAVGAPSTLVERRERIDTSAPRLTIGDTWIDFEIQSDPFVVPTWRGYAPAILVRRDNVTSLEHVFVGASSLAQELETLRSRYDTLRGLRVSICKDGPTKFAGYRLHVKNEHGGDVS